MPLLVDKIAYSEEEVIELEEEDQTVMDDPKNIKPFIHTNHRHQGNDDDDDDVDVSNWSIRKCAATSIDSISTVFKDDLLPHLLPIIQAYIQDADWKRRESAILCLGAIADGCQKGMRAHLANLVPFLISLMGDANFLVRSISCWTLSRYARWISQQPTEKYLQPLIEGLLTRMLEKSKKVQEAACSAFANVEEEALGDLLPWLEQILRTLNQCFEFYQVISETLLPSSPFNRPRIC